MDWLIKSDIDFTKNMKLNNDKASTQNLSPDDREDEESQSEDEDGGGN